MGNTIKDVFQVQGVVDRAADAVVHILTQDDQLNVWSGGRIFVSTTFEPPDSIALPLIAVSVVSEEETFSVSKRTEIKLPIGVLLVWEEFHETKAAGEATIATVVDHIKQLMYHKDNYHLRVPPDYTPLVRRLDNYEVVNYEQEKYEDRILCALVIRILYDTTFNVDNRNPFIP